MNLSWSFYQIWNESIEQGRPQRVLEPRNKIWASELGGAFIDRFLKMKGVAPSNPPNPRSLRKFEAGNIWEAIIGFVLMRAGILQNKQEYLTYQYEGSFPVNGKLDYIAGGKPDYDKAVFTIVQEFDWLPEFISRAMQNIVEKLKGQFPNGLPEIILEVKSCSSYMFEQYEAKQTGSRQHKLQAFHYLKAKPMKEAHIVYISKDDARLLEVGVFNPSSIEQEYQEDIQKITNYLTKDEQPPLEKPIVFDIDTGRFIANWKVGYSNYLTMIYHIENQMVFDNLYKPKATKWNRVLGRIKADKNLTQNNIQAIKEIEKEGFDIDELLKTFAGKQEDDEV